MTTSIPTQPQKARPNINTYWVTENILAGEYVGNKKNQVAEVRIQAFIDCGVSYFIDLTEKDELTPYEDLLPAVDSNNKPIHYQRHAIKDVSIPKERAEMVAILQSIESALSEGHIVYVHCWGGVGRTGTVVGCYLKQQYQLDGTAALNHLREQLWPQCAKSSFRESPETYAQENFVINF